MKNSIKPVIIYSTPTCHFCHLAKDYFASLNIPYEMLDISMSEDLQKKVFEMTGKLAVPVIEIGDTVQVGFSEKTIEPVLREMGYIK